MNMLSLPENKDTKNYSNTRGTKIRFEDNFKVYKLSIESCTYTKAGLNAFPPV